MADYTLQPAALLNNKPLSFAFYHLSKPLPTDANNVAFYSLKENPEPH